MCLGLRTLNAYDDDDDYLSLVKFNNHQMLVQYLAWPQYSTDDHVPSNFIEWGPTSMCPRRIVTGGQADSTSGQSPLGNHSLYN